MSLWFRANHPMTRRFATTFRHKLQHNLTVIWSRSKTKDGAEWDHLSISHKNRVPTWDEISQVKKSFLGEEVEAYQVLPKKSEYVNICVNCLHIWAPRDGKRRVANLQDLVDEQPPPEEALRRLE